MDPVSRILVEREQSRSRLLPWVIVAVLLRISDAARRPAPAPPNCPRPPNAARAVISPTG